MSRTGPKLRIIRREWKKRRAQKARLRNKRQYAKIKGSGQIDLHVWTHRDLYLKHAARARVAGFPAATLLRAALEYGLPRVLTSDLINADRAWRHIVGFPVAPRWPGVKHDASRQFPIKEASRIRMKRRRELFLREKVAH